MQKDNFEQEISTSFLMKQWKELMPKMCNFSPVFSCQKIDEHLLSYKKTLILNLCRNIDRHFLIQYLKFFNITANIDRRFLHKIEHNFSQIIC